MVHCRSIMSSEVPSSLERSRIAKGRDDAARKTLQTNFTTLVAKINVTTTRRVLYENRAIDIEFFHKLTESSKTENEKSETLLTYLINKGDEGYKQLVVALKQSGVEDKVQANLAEILEQCYMEVEVMDECSLSGNRSEESSLQHYPSEHSSCSPLPSRETSGFLSASQAVSTEQICSIESAITVKKNCRAVKILVLGDKGVGKTSLILKYARNDFDIHNRPTIAMDVVSSVINFRGKDFVINFWDPAGQSRPNTLTRRYFQGAHGAVMVYDCTRSRTLDSIINWKTELDDRVYKRDGDALPTILVGTKCDLERLDGSSMCQECGFLNHYLVSSKTAKNVKQSMDYLLTQILSDTISLQDSHYNDTKPVTITIGDSSTECDRLQGNNPRPRNKCC